VDLSSKETLTDQLSKNYQAGFELHTWSTAPQGSGLGTSSILAGVILASLLRVTDRTASLDSLVHAVMIVEQMLTTGGGWQDNVGGLVPGFKISRSQARLPLKVEAEKLELSEKAVEDLCNRLVCFYSGRTRLAKNLLQVNWRVYRFLTGRRTRRVWFPFQIIVKPVGLESVRHSWEGRDTGGLDMRKRCGRL